MKCLILIEKISSALRRARCGTRYPTKCGLIPERSCGQVEQSQDKERDALDVWLSEINYTSIDLHEDPKAYVKCRSKNNLINYCNLVRYDASRIGCAKKVCDGKTSILCLTNKE
ncbi:hypothetical protein Y032_0489g2361 [Ancylostoma ceylanicum]|uniref:SCP domain-containing protein n=1 Tax=Ancylostoma ceylanicum TaxID=53326 RepID=A0A016WVG7_9BILA|nr:hypothetical protein Y032_0489g2361 [Ancylostoma ceylanicum]